MDNFSKSDPFVEVFEHDDGLGWNLIGKTEKIDNNNDPIFEQKVRVVYEF